MAFPPCHSFMFQTHEDPDLHLSAAAASSAINNLPSCLPQHFHGGGGGGGGVPFMMKRSLSFSGVDDKCSHHHYDHHQALHGGGGGGDQDDLSDDGSQMLIGEKKKRLNLEQVKTLEKSFEMGNKLEPERKLQLAKALGLQPRQVAIWFQNRRARWKTKQLEKDYDVLKKKFDALKADNDALQSHNKKLQAELLAVKGGSKDSNFEGGLSNNNNNLKKETTDQGSWSNGSTDDNSSDHVNLDMSRSTTPAANSPPSNAQIITNGSKNLFRSSLCRPPHAGITQLLQGSSRGVDQMIQDDQAFCTMFNNGSIDQDHQGGFWPWPPATEQPHHFH